MTCVQIGSIHIDSFKNGKKIKWAPRCHGNQPKSPKRGKKCLHAGKNISSSRNIVKLNFWHAIAI